MRVCEREREREFASQLQLISRKCFPPNGVVFLSFLAKDFNIL